VSTTLPSEGVSAEPEPEADAAEDEGAPDDEN
jgi:hypothetical protein